jgi:hypothetical protein
VGSASDIYINYDRPIEIVRQIFSATGIQGVMTSSPSGDMLKGYFPCDSPPTVGFNLPSKANASAAAADRTSLVSHTSTLFNIPADAWAFADNGNNNCTAALSGQDFVTAPGLWVVGQGMLGL